MLNILIASIISSIMILSAGILFQYLFLGDKKNYIKFYESGIFGIIFLSFFSLFVNFFFPINKMVGTFTLLIAVFYFIIIFLNSEKKRELLIIISSTALISFIMVVFANINRPDAGLYHLPYVSLINETKIVFGSVNIHARFGHISILQYLSAIFNNYFFIIEFITLPLASIFSFFLYFLFNRFLSSKNNLERKITLVYFLIIIFSIYAFNRYSNYGNDIPAHIYFFILLIFFMEIKDIKIIKKNQFFKILFVFIFLVTMKFYMILASLLVFLIFFYQKIKKELVLNKSFFLFLFFVFLWLSKNIISSGCLFYPITQTCFNSFKHFDKKTEIIANEGEAWAKAVVATKVKYKSHKEYNSDFMWLSTWKTTHLKKIEEKITPFIIFLTILLLLNIYKKSYSSNIKNIDAHYYKKIFIIVLFNLFCIFIWFVKFPLYRFGMSFLNAFLIFTFVYFFDIKNNIYNHKFFKKVMTIFLILGFIGFFGKNLYRIHYKNNQDYNNAPWPRIYTLDDTKKNISPIFKKVINFNDQTMFYYSSGKECMYSPSPCSNYQNQNLFMDLIYGYKFYYKK